MSWRILLLILAVPFLLEFAAGTLADWCGARAAARMMCG